MRSGGINGSFRSTEQPRLERAGAIRRHSFVRPDQHVPSVLPLDGHDELAEFLGRFMTGV
jgi:hypothetical protein